MSDEPTKWSWVCIWWTALVLFVVYPISGILATELNLRLHRDATEDTPLLVIYWPLFWLLSLLGG
jgi:hypothetical protein